MNKTLKTLLVGTLSAATLACAAIGFAACGDNNDPPENQTKFTDGIYISTELQAGSGRYNYIRFHEDGVFYAAFSATASGKGGALQQAGYWKLVEENYTFTKYLNEEDTVEVTAPAYFELTTFAGAAYDLYSNMDSEDDAVSNKLPYVDDTVYGLYFKASDFKHDTTNTTFTIDDESNIEVASFVKEAGATYKLTISHTGQFSDFISDDEDTFDGTWTYVASTRTYTLKDGDKTATLVVSEDGNTAVYTDFKGATQNLINANAVEKETKIVLTGEGVVSTYFPSETMVSLYVDNTFKIYTSVDMSAAGMGTQEQTQKGTWSETSGVITLTVTEGINDESVTSYTVNKNADGKYEFEFSFIMYAGAEHFAWNVTEVKTAISVVAEVACDFFTLKFSNDGTYKVVAVMGETTREMKAGFWSLAIPTLTVDGTDYNMTAEGVTVVFSLTTSSGTNDYNFVMTRDQLLALNAAEIVEAKAIVEVACDYFTLKFCDNGTYKVVAVMGETTREMKAGFWSLAIPTLTVDGTDYTMSAEGVTVTLSLTTSAGANDYDFVMTRDQLMALNA